LLVLVEQLVQLAGKVTLSVVVFYMLMAVLLVVQAPQVVQVVAVLLLVMQVLAVPAPMQQVIKVSKHLRLQVHILG
jgi:hypothetical protein